MNQPASNVDSSSLSDLEAASTAGTTGASPGAGDVTAGTSERGQAAGHETLHRWAGKAHQAIDQVERKLSGGGGAAGSGRVARLKSKLSGDESYVQHARQYGEQVQQRVRDQPLQVLGIVFAAGVVFSKLFLGRHRRQVEVVEVNAYLPPPRVALRDWGDRTAVHSHDAMHRLGDSGHHAARRLGATAESGATRARLMGSRLWHEARHAMPSREQVSHRSHEYADLAREQLRERPLLGAALALGLAALVIGIARPRQDDPMRW